MPSVLSHAVAALGIGACFYRPGVPNRVWLAGAVCSMVPDIDVVGFDNTRYFFPWTPIRVSPIGISRFFSSRGLAVVQSELVWVWFPTLVLVAVVWFVQSRIYSQTTTPP